VHSVPESRPLFLNAMLFDQQVLYLGVKVTGKSLSSCGILPLGNVDSLYSLLTLRTSPRADLKSKFGYDESVVSPAFRSADSLGHSDILPVLPADDDIVDEVPMFRSWMHPGRLLTVW